jgi:hypothetical protein
MKKKYLLMGFAGLVVLALAAVVYAWAYDTDGGRDPYTPGTCFDHTGNYTDFCLNETYLAEMYAVNGEYCDVEFMFCGGEEVGSYCHDSPVGSSCDWVG